MPRKNNRVKETSGSKIFAGLTRREADILRTAPLAAPLSPSTGLGWVVAAACPWSPCPYCIP